MTPEEGKQDCEKHLSEIAEETGAIQMIQKKFLVT